MVGFRITNLTRASYRYVFGNREVELPTIVARRESCALELHEAQLLLAARQNEIVALQTEINAARTERDTTRTELDAVQREVRQG